MLPPRLLPSLAAALAAAALLTGCDSPDGSPTASPVSSPSPTAGVACADAVDVTIDVRDPATGWAFLVLSNTGDVECSLSGFPEVVALDPVGAEVGSRSEQSDGFGRAGTAVVLPPGDRAYAELIYTPAAKVGLGECDPEVPVRGFSVTVPGATHEEFVDVPDLTFCTGEDWMTLSSVGPVDSEARAASS
ncbi:DUF4232 domain-containing protein [Naasia sp. SYSU D00948]|uniref:DUF4232 domain-containing protein n=1 Tax=Naasia sp. SYSU D00948 TaxID=2817379 RepID=UPI001B304AD3|nr:DUF4232 domain-containing protein [Naasia sp. SYSU D00948]